MAAPHPHPPGHSHVPLHGPDGHGRAFAIGIGLNLAFVAVEAFWGWRIDSLALLADAGHNLGDVAGLVLAWGGALAGRLPPDARHTYGWKRASLMAAFFNALLLLVAMGTLGWEALHRLNGTAQLPSGLTVIAVAGLGIGVNAATAWLFMRSHSRDLNIRGAFLHMLADALVSAGVVVAGGLGLLYGWTWIDPAISLLIVLVIVLSTWSLLRQSLHLLFDGVPDELDLAEVRALLAALPGVAEVADLHVWAMGSSQIALTAHLVVPAGHPGDAFLHMAMQRLEERFEIEHVTLQLMQAPLDSGGCGRST